MTRTWERAIAVVDLGFGDAGKGLVVDYLARRGPAPGLVVRFNGGAQAGHNVVTPDGRHHTFAQFGAGTFVPGVRTHLASRVVVHPTGLLVEAERLRSAGVTDALARITVSPDAPVVTPFHQAACRLRELARGSLRHGSCGVGVGEVMRDALANEPVRVRDLAGAMSLRRRLEHVRERIRRSLEGVREAATRAPGGHDELRVLDEAQVAERWIEAVRGFVARVGIAGDEVVGTALAAGERVVFEGAQGVLLDEDWGFHPYTTWSRCTFANALELMGQVCPGEPLFRLGVARLYAHRHGPGPLPSESPELASILGEPHNVRGPWQGPFRVGWTDLVLARHAQTATGGVDGLALTHLDAFERMPQGGTPWKLAESYEDGVGVGAPTTHETADLDARAASTARLMSARPRLVRARAAEVVEALGTAYRAPVLLRSSGPTYLHVAE